MDKSIISNLVEKNFSQRQIASELNVSQSTVRYWLKFYDLKTMRGPGGKHPKDFQLRRICKCGETDPKKFYGNKKTRCRLCHNEDNKKRQRSNKDLAVKFLGGKCIYCEYSKSNAALDVHHLDPEQKATDFNMWRSWGKQKLLDELQKCILLCKNCHMEEHYG